MADRRASVPGRSATRAMVAAVVVATALVAAPPVTAQSLEPLPAPATQLSADGLSATDGLRTLHVSRTASLDPHGVTLTIAGSGYDSFKGIYVAFCLIPPTNQQPTPCGGGATIEGTTGASHWISSNAPGYGQGLAVPYGPGGSFDVTMTVSSTIGPNVDCQRVRCAIVTRNDHSRTTDRSQDIFVPLSFAAPVVAPPAVDSAPPPPTEPPSTPPPPTTLPEVDDAVGTETTISAAPPEPTTTAVPDDLELAASESAGGEASTSARTGWLWASIGVAAIAVVSIGTGTVVAVRRRSSPGWS